MMNALGLVVALALGADFAPYVRSKTGEHCLWWPDKTIAFQQSVVGNSMTGDKAFAAVTTSFATWQVTMQQCSGVSLAESARTTSRKIGVETGATATNANLVLFRMSSCKKKVSATDACWAAGTCGNQYDCWDHATALLGITTVSYNTSTGRMFDADIELNGADNVFTTVDAPVCTGKANQTCVATDVQNTVTHEIGHLMGLDHTKLTGSTMGSTATMGETSKRSLDVGTKEFICAVYQKNLPPLDCTLEPVSAELGEPAVQRGCSTSASGAAMPVLALVMLYLLGRRRREGLAVASMLMVGTAAQASTVGAMSIDELITSSDLIVRGTVARVSSRWNADGSRIVTDIELAVTERWADVAATEGHARSVVVTLPGGIVGDIAQHVSGVPSFAAGQDAVLFLEQRGPGFTLTGFSQGAFLVEGQWVHQQLGDVQVVGAFTGHPVDARPESLTLAQLKRLVMGTVAEVPSPLFVVP